MGNPQFLEEIIRHMEINRRLFVNRDKSAALTDPGFSEIRHLTVERHRLNTRRFLDLPEPARGALAIGSLQGQRLLQDLTVEVCAVVGYPDAKAVQHRHRPRRNAMRQSDQTRSVPGPSFCNNSTARSLNRIYQMSPTATLFSAGIVAALHHRIDNPDGLATLSAEDRLATLGVAWFILRDAPEDAQATLAATAAAMVIEERLARRDYLGAGAQAQALVDAMRARQAMRLPPERLWTVILALRTIGDWERTRFAAEQMLASAIGDDPGSRRLRLSASTFLAEALERDPEARIDLGRAEQLYLGALDETRALARELDTPEARRDVSVSLDNVANAARAKGDLAAAERLFAESLDIRRALARELDTPEARRDVSVSLDNVANAARAKGDLAAAERLFAESLDIRRALARELDTPAARRDGVGFGWTTSPAAARARGDLAGAERLFAESLELRRALARELDTPEARRDVSVSLDNVANAARAKGDLAAAERLFAESLDMSRALARELDTPEARRDLAVSLLNVAAIAEEQGDLAAARAALRESRTTAQAFGQQQPVSDAADIIAFADESLRRMS